MIYDDTFLLEPNWRHDLSLRFRWMTNILKTINRYEQRGSTYTFPRRIQKYTVTFRSASEAAYARGKIFKNLHNVWLVPLWEQQATLTSQASSGTNTLTLTGGAYLDWLAKSPVILFDDKDNFEVKQITSWSNPTLTLETNLASTWPAGTLVYPCLQARCAESQPLTHSTGRYGNMRVTFEEVVDIDITQLSSYVGKTEGRLGDFSKYNGLFILDKEPNWVRAMDQKWIHMRDILKYYGVEEMLTYQTETELIFGCEYMAKNRNEVIALRDFFNFHRGRWRHFWIPTWVDDFVITSAISSSDTSLTVEDFDWNTYYNSAQEFGQHIAIILGDGTIIPKTITSVSGDTTVNLDSAVGVNVPADELGSIKCSFLIPARFDYDEIEFTFRKEGFAIVNSRFASLNDDPMRSSTSTTTSHTTTSTTITTTTSTTTTIEPVYSPTFSNGSYDQEPFTSLAAWNQNSGGAGVVEQMTWKSAEVAHLYGGIDASGNYANIGQDLGDIDQNTMVLTFRTYFTVLGADYPYDFNGGLRGYTTNYCGLQFRIKSNGIWIYRTASSSSAFRIQKTEPVLNRWEWWTIVCDITNPDDCIADVYKGNYRYCQGLHWVNKSVGTAGFCWFYANRLCNVYLDVLYAGNGTTSTPPPSEQTTTTSTTTSTTTTV